MRTCTICRDTQRDAIDEALVRGEPLRDIARRTATKKDALARHAAGHLSAKLARSETAAAVSASSLWDRVIALQRETQAILADARAARDHPTALRAIARAEAQIQLMGQIATAARGAGSPERDRAEEAIETLRKRREGRRAIETTALPAPEATGDANGPER